MKKYLAWLSAIIFFISPGIVFAADITMYSDLTGGSYSNFNDNAPINNYAWSFQLENVGTPHTLKIYNNDSVAASASFCLKADKTTASTSYGCVATSTLVSGLNTFTLSTTALMNSTSTVYWTYMSVSSLAITPPRINYNYPGSARNAIWRSSASNINPDTSWFSGDIKMEIIGTEYVPPAPTSTAACSSDICQSNLEHIYLWIITLVFLSSSVIIYKIVS